MIRNFKIPVWSYPSHLPFTIIAHLIHIFLIFQLSRVAFLFHTGQTKMKQLFLIQFTWNKYLWRWKDLLLIFSTVSCVWIIVRKALQIYFLLIAKDVQLFLKRDRYYSNKVLLGYLFTKQQFKFPNFTNEFCMMKLFWLGKFQCLMIIVTIPYTH